MKSKTLGILAALTLTSHAITLTWNGPDSGNWDIATTNWLDGVTTATWNNTTPDSAVFGSTGAGTVNLTEGITAGGITFDAAGYIIAGNTLTLTGSTTIVTNANALISSTVAGGGLTKTGSATLTLSGANTYTGGTAVNAGTLAVTNWNTTTLGAGTNPAVAVGTGATLSISGTTTSSTKNLAAITLASGSTLNLSANGTNSNLNKAIDVTGDTTVNLTHTGSANRGNSFVLKSTTAVNVIVNGYTSGDSAGAGWMIGGDYFNQGATEAGSLALGSSLTFNGSGTVNAPNLTLGWTAVGAATLKDTDFIIGNTATNAGVFIGLAGNTAPICQVGSLAGGTAALTQIFSDNLAGTLQINNGTTTGANFAGTIRNGTGGTVALIKNGSGTQILSGTNTYTGGTTVNAGTLKAGASTSVFGTNSAVSIANIDGATLDLADYNVAIGSLAGGGSSGGKVKLGSGTLTTGGKNTSTSFSGIIEGTGGLTKTGTGTLTLAGTNNSYTGATTVNSGTLALVGGSQASPITVNNAATSLGFTLGSDTTSTSTVTFGAGTTVKITGTPTLASYTLMTASSITGTPVLSTPIAGYTLSLNGGNTLVLAQSTGYSSWASGKGLNGTNNGALQDPNNNGITNLLEYVLNGEPLNAGSPSAILPSLDDSGSNFVFTFHRRNASKDDTTQTFQYGSDLSGWTDVTIPATSAGAVTITPGSPTGIDLVVVSVPKSGTVMFGRLKATQP